jgi:AAA family ATP:ADP antiporter
MRRVITFCRSAVDVREGEGPRTLFMALYLLAVLFAYYILKPVSRAMFLARFNIDDLPYLYILIALVGGLLATLYTKVAVRTSLQAAVAWATAIAVACLVTFWWLLQLKLSWMLYVFNIWVSLFGVVLVSQGWLVAANVFDTREAKRLYGLVGLGAVVGAWTGSAFTSFTVKLVGTDKLVLASAFLVTVSYAMFRLVTMQKGVSLGGARGAEATEEEGFSAKDIFAAIRRHHHLQVLTAIITLTFIVDVMIDYQWQAAAKLAYQGGEQIAAFMSTFYLFQNIVTFILQSVFTGLIVRTLGVGGTLKLMPSAIAAASLGSFFAPGVLTASITRLTEAASRYTFNRTGMEILYLPLPADLRNRTKAFVDIFVDRMGRGIGGMLLVVFTWVGLTDPRKLPVVVIGFAVAWVIVSNKAQREYVQTVRKRLEARRLDLESARVSVGDPGTLEMLERVAGSKNPRQACYALSLLGEVPGYKLDRLLVQLVNSPSAEVRGKVYELARTVKFPELVESALAEVRSSPGTEPYTLKPAVGYVLTLSADPESLIREFMEHENPLVTEGVLESIPEELESARELIASDWLSKLEAEPDPDRRRLAAVAIGICGDEGTEALHRLLEDHEPRVVAAACRAAGAVKNRAYLYRLIPRLADSKLRGVVIESLATYGVRIAGTLGDILEDEKVEVPVRRQIPRVLRLIPDQRSVDVLLRSISQPNLTIRATVLKALNRLRETAPNLDYGATFVTKQILSEARVYFTLAAALVPFRSQTDRRTAAGLLALSLEERLDQTLERLFRLLGLRYPPKEIYAAYLAVHHRRQQQFATALEFLDNVLDREFKKILLPLLDDSGHLAERGRELFGVEVKNTEDAIRELIHSGDSWLVTCAMAAAAELKLRSLAPDISQAAKAAGIEIFHVAQSAKAALA